MGVGIKGRPFTFTDEDRALIVERAAPFAAKLLEAFASADPAKPLLHPSTQCDVETEASCPPATDPGTPPENPAPTPGQNECVSTTRAEDVDCDGTLGCADLEAVKDCLSEPVTGACAPADITHDGVINILDLSAVAAALVGADC